jgi:alpha-tubulin suppressor-like RCC1 family protein
VVWDANGDLWTWGEGRDGATGSGSKADVLAPRKVEGGAMAEAKAAGLRVVGAACGRDHTLVLLDNGAVLAMGADDVGQCGTGQAALRHVEPVWVRGLQGGSDQPKAVVVLAGEQHSVALTADGVVMAWGGNNSGQLMTGDRSDVGLPRAIDMSVFGGMRVVDGAAGGSHTLLRAEDGRVFACGRGRNGQLGRGTELESIAAFRVLPVEVVALGEASGASVKALAAGSDHSLALVEDRS